MDYRNKIMGIKIVLFICLIYVIFFVVIYELPWLLHLGRDDDLVKVEATNEGVSADRYQKSKFTIYQTKVKYIYNGEIYEGEILSDIRDWKNDSIFLYLKYDCPERVYRDRVLLIPISPASIGAWCALGLSLFLMCYLCKLKKEEIKDYKIPNNTR